MNGSRPKMLIFAVYKTNEGDWRGFCVPYDVTCNASTLKEAKIRLEKLVDLYEEGLEKYNYPQELSIKKLSDSEDQRVWDKNLQEITASVAEHKRKQIQKQFMDYKPNWSFEENFEIKNVQGVQSYYREYA